jgi:uncharacterized protein YndB with AHSA1/START domain
MTASLLRVASVAAALVGILIAPTLVQAQQPRSATPGGTPGQAPADAPPVAVGPDWQYERRGEDVHMFHCRQGRCVPPSRVSYRLYAPNNAMTVEQFRREQETVVKALEQRGPPGTRITILDITGDEGTGPRRMFTSRRRIDHADGAKEYVSSSLLLGERYSASLISSSLDEAASRANHAIFVVGVMLFINVSPQAKP